MATTAEKPPTQSSTTSGGSPTGSTKPVSGKSTGALPKVVGNATPKEAPQPSLGQRMLGMLRGSRVSPPANKPAAPKPASAQQPDRFPPGFWRKRMLGMLLLVGGMFVILYGIEFLDISFPQLGLMGTIAPSKANIPILSGLSYELLILAILFGGLYILIYRLGLFPNPNPPASTAQRSSGGASGSGTPAARKPVNATPGIGERRTRADRRYAAERAAERAARAREAKIARENSGMRGMLNKAFKREVAAEKTSAAAKAPTTKTKAASAGSTKAAKAPVATETNAPKATTPSEHDAMYERVKADQRQRRRREGKR